MPEWDRGRLATWAAVAVVFAALGIWYLARSQPGRGAPGAPPAAIRVEGADRGGPLVVDVAGAVRRPGVYRLAAGARVDDAVRRAGGPTQRADLAQLNLAAKLEDGRQVLVPLRDAGGASAAGVGAAAAPAAPPVDLNTATAEQLDQLDGVGPETARKILEYRQAHGGFGSVEELGQVPGIGPKRLAALRDKVRV